MRDVLQRPRLSELPYRPPQNVQVIYRGQARAALQQLVGHAVTDEELAVAMGALDDARIEVFNFEDRVMTLAHHLWLREEQQRYLYRNAQGELLIKNQLFKLHEYALPGVGLESFTRQVLGARALGVKRILTFAAGSYEERNEWIGYYVWPRFGFQADLTILEQETLPLPLQGAKTIHDLMKREEGIEYWFRWGFGRDMIFHLDARSSSIKTLILYWREKNR